MIMPWLRRAWGTFTGRVGRSGRADPSSLPAWLHHTRSAPPIQVAVPQVRAPWVNSQRSPTLIRPAPEPVRQDRSGRRRTTTARSKPEPTVFVVAGGPLDAAT